MNTVKHIALSLVLIVCGCRVQNSNVALAVIANPDASDAQVKDVLVKLSASRPEEGEGFWLKIISDSEYSEYRRRECLRELFERYVRPGTPISELAKFNNVLLFDRTNLVNVSPFVTKVSIRRSMNDCVFEFQNLLLANTHSAIYLRLSEGVSQADLLKSIHDDSSISNLTILEAVMELDTPANSTRDAKEK